MSDSPHFTVSPGRGPIVATAIHDGHAVRPSLLKIMNVSEAERLRDEDPHTGLLTAVGDARLIMHTSRFEVDVNRPREKAVYMTPDDAWGLQVWREQPGEAELRRSLAIYDEFYATVERLLSRAEAEYGAFVLLDLHSYNHRREGADAPPADPLTNPVVNVGTGNTDAVRWRGLIDRFMADLAAFEHLGEPLDVRENVKFTGGHFTRWVHERFPETSCCLAVEFKKTFMDEWGGGVCRLALTSLAEMLEAAVPGIREELAAGSGACSSR